MAEIPFLGCKISLISKCDIRYEGILYCVDPKESTIALSKVKSYGTETRADENNYVAPKNDIYDIIIFRASDVKDLRVDQPDTFQDPAIISAQQSSSFARQAPSTTTTNITATTTNITAGANDGSLPTQRQQQSQQSRQQHPHQPSQQANNKQHQHQQHPQQKTLLPFLPANKNVRRDDSRGDGDMRRHEGRRNEDNRRHDDRRMTNGDRRDQGEGRRDGGGVGGGGGGSGVRPNNKLSRGGYENNRNNAATRHIGNNSNSYSRRGPSNNIRDENSKAGGGYRRGGPMTGGRRPRSGDRTGAPRGNRKTAPLKFEGEYDFDEANKLFAELDSKFKGLKLGKQGDKEAELSGDVNASKSPTGRSESGSGYDSEENKDGDSKDEGSVTDEYYDRSKSFFDNISCEASERSQGKVGKTDWRKERKINAETFGISANYRRGGYRGRIYGANGYRR